MAIKDRDQSHNTSLKLRYLDTFKNRSAAFIQRFLVCISELGKVLKLLASIYQKSVGHIFRMRFRL